MKRILLITFLCFIAVQGFSQSLFGIYGGAGCATKHNYDVGPTFGVEYLHGASHRTFIGADIFYQTYSLFADNEANSAHNRTGIAGTTDRLLANYAFFAPKITMGLRKTEAVKFNLTIGIGYNISGYDSLHKWDNGYYTNAYYTNPTGGTGQYDSTIDKSKNINKMLLRIGVGATEYVNVGRAWFITFTEDFSFVSSSLTQTGTSTDVSRTLFSTNGLRPGYVTLTIGFTHCSRCAKAREF